MIDYRLEHICSYTATLATPPEVIGPVPEGIRANFYVTSGEMTGPRIRGKFRPVGGDWLTVRTDGVAVLDVRATVETHDGALILVTYQGVSDVGPDGYQRFLEQNLPPVIPIRVAPRFVTAHPDYVWLNRLQCLGIGEYHAATNVAAYDVYAVR
jgi:uncharacterized protein DUF3237